MGKLIATAILLIIASINTYCQDTAATKNKNSIPYVKDFGPYTVTMNNGHITLTKNPNYDWSKAIQRDTSYRSRWDNGIIEIYTYNSDQPIIKKNFISGFEDEVSENVMSKQERLAKYNSTKAVLTIHLKNGVLLVNGFQLLNKFNISPKNDSLPLYLDYEPIGNPDDLLAIPDAVLRIDVIKDGDGFRFLNITTKAWDAERKKYAGQVMMYIR